VVLTYCLLHVQIDPSETLDPEVEDVLVDIAEDFIDSVSFGTTDSQLPFVTSTCMVCSLWMSIRHKWDKSFICRTRNYRVLEMLLVKQLISS